MRKSATFTMALFVCGLGLLLRGVGELLTPLEQEFVLNFGVSISGAFYLHITIWLFCTAVILLVTSRTRLFLNFEDAELKNAVDWVSAYLALIAFVSTFYASEIAREHSQYREVPEIVRWLRISYIPVEGFLIPTYLLSGTNEIWKESFLKFLPSIYAPRLFWSMLKHERKKEL